VNNPPSLLGDCKRRASATTLIEKLLFESRKLMAPLKIVFQSYIPQTTCTPGKQRPQLDSNSALKVGGRFYQTID